MHQTGNVFFIFTVQGDLVFCVFKGLYVDYIIAALFDLFLQTEQAFSIFPYSSHFSFSACVQLIFPDDPIQIRSCVLFTKYGYFRIFSQFPAQFYHIHTVWQELVYH